MKIQKLLGIAILSLFTLDSSAENFNKTFCDSTLRVDYIFGGGPSGINILLESQSKQCGWAGRKNRLKETPVEGNGTIYVTDPLTGDTLYCNTFSSLFQEWLTTQEAEQINRSFQNSFLLPLPKKEVDITLSLRNNRRIEISKTTHRYRPEDELTAIRGANPLSYTYIHEAKDKDNAIDVAILAEGYTESEMDTFLRKARLFTEEILRYEPFASNKDKFNFIAVKSHSKESGVSIPLKNIWKDTALDSHFSTFHSSRYLTTPNVWRMHSLLEGIPYEHIIVLVNTPEYGGGGIYNCYQIATADHEYSLPVVVHEFGHSFAGLADEYFYTEEEDETYPLDVEPWEPNITTLVDFDSKWKDMIDEGMEIPTPVPEQKDNSREFRIKEAGKGFYVEEPIIGAYEGGGYRSKGIYRPVESCRMRDNFNPNFCPVCQRAIQRIIDFYTEK